MRDLPLNALRAFALVYAHRGVRAAARELGVAHSSLSRHLAELEAWMGTPLTHEGAGRGGRSSEGGAIPNAQRVGIPVAIGVANCATRDATRISPCGDDTKPAARSSQPATRDTAPPSMT